MMRMTIVRGTIGRGMATAVVLAGMAVGAFGQQQTEGQQTSGQQTPGQQTAGQQTGPVRDSSAVSVGGAQSGTAHSWTTEQLLTSTVHEAWMLSGRNEDQFFDMVKELAAMSAQKRGLTLPETAEAGAKAGAMIKREARKDPDQLLYAVVDRAVMKTAVKGPAAAAAAAGAK